MADLAPVSAPSSFPAALAAPVPERATAVAVPPVGAPLEPEEDEVTFNAPWLVCFRHGEVEVHPIDNAVEATMAASALGAGDDLIVVFDARVHGVSDKASQAVQTDAQRRRHLRKKKLRVVSPFVRSGGITLHTAGTPARAGADDELMFYWSLSGTENKTGKRSPSGAQKLVFTAGEDTVGTLVLHWDNDR